MTKPRSPQDAEAALHPQSQPHPQQRHFISFVVVYTMIIFNGCCFTAIVPSVPFYLQTLNAPPSFLGWVVSFYSVGQLIGSPVAGYLGSFYSARQMLSFSSALGLISSLIYAVVPSYWFVLLSRLLTGISAGWEFATELAYIARGTSIRERTAFLASVTAVGIAGFVLGPVLASILALLDFSILWGLVSVNKYTGPGWILAFMFMVDWIMVRTLFQDHPNTDATDQGEPTDESRLLRGTKKQMQPESYSNNGPSDDEPLPSFTVVVSLIFVQFAVMCAWSVLETIASPLAQDKFNWNVQECNLLFACGGLLSLLVYMAFLAASKWVQDRWMITSSLLFYFMGLMLMIDWEELEWILGQMSLIVPYLYRFLLGYMMLMAAFVIGRPVTFALYSKLIASQHQAKYLSWMIAGGSAARTLGPFGAVYLYYHIQGAGNNLLSLFGSEATFQIVCLGLVVYLWPKLLPAG